MEKLWKKNKVTIDADFESILVQENNGKQNPEKSVTNKYQKHIACKNILAINYYVLMTNLVKTYLGKNAVYNFTNNMIEESNYCSDVVKEHFYEELVMTKQDNEDFKHSIKCLICDNDDIDNDVEVRDHCHMPGKYRGSAHKDCNINLKLNH